MTNFDFLEVSGRLLPGKIALRTISPWMIAPKDNEQFH